jgi:hypothetical protein
VRGRLKRAGIRLAHLLNSLLGQCAPKVDSGRELRDRGHGPPLESMADVPYLSLVRVPVLLSRAQPFLAKHAWVTA